MSARKRKEGDYIMSKRTLIRNTSGETTTNTSDAPVKSVDSILAKYGYSSGKPKVDHAKNLEFAQKMFCKALIASNFTPVDKEDVLGFENGSFIVEFHRKHWKMYKGENHLEDMHFGKGSINLVRWHMKHAG
jgi:hypothetical protein